MTTVFVYGTLKKGFRLHQYLGNSQFVGAAEVSGFTLFDSGFNFPIAVRSAGETVDGELYLVDDKTLAVLDEIELPAGYVRKAVKIGKVNAQMYFKDVNFVSMQYMGFKYIGSSWNKR